MTFDPSITLGNVLTIASILVSVGVAWARLSFLEAQIRELKVDVRALQQVMITQAGELQKVIGQFELHTRSPHHHAGRV